ncbi:MAG: GAF domain-containing protein [Planctomycetota bacterium]
MGQRLVEMYAQANALGGFPAKVRLAGLMGITSTQAGTVPDSPDLIAKCEEALRAMKADAPAKSAGTSTSVVARPGKDAEARLRRFNQIIAEVMGQRSVFFARPEETFSRLTEAAAQGIECGRASIWFYDDERTTIRCADLFERENGKHSAGIELRSQSFPGYFKALETERTIAAHDAHKDPRTSEFSKPYLAPLGIGALLDVPIWVEGIMVGVLCHEHLGGRREWTIDDENFAYAMGGFAALAEERRLLRRRS